MDIKTHQLTVNKTARYACYGELSEKTKYLWLALHGSHMTCEQMLYKFADFDPKEHFVIAPEGLSRFYLKGMSGDVVASWMTKRDRLLEIQDLCDYLSQLWTLYLEKIVDLYIVDIKSVKKILLGFSQGGTSAFRWLHAHKTDFDFFFPYAAWIPDDIDYSVSATNFSHMSSHFSYGKQDQYLTEDRITVLKDLLIQNNLPTSIIPHEGDHRIDRNHLMHLFKSIVLESQK